MRKDPYFRPILAILPALLAVLAPLQADTAENQPRIRSVDKDFALYMMKGVWVQRFVTVTNPTDQPRLLRVACLVTSSQTGGTRYSTAGWVPARSDRRLELAIRPQEMRAFSHGEDPNETAMQGRRAVEVLFALWDEQTGEELHRYPDQSNEIDPDKTRLARVFNVSDPLDTHSYLPKMPHEVLGDLKIIGLAVRDMPTRWYGYETASLAMAGGIDLTLASASNIEALLDWVRKGGLLVVTGNAVVETMFQGELARAAGVVAVGHHAIDTLRISDARDPLSGQPTEPVELQLRDPLPMAELMPVDAEVLMKGNGLPLLTRRRCGRGQVYVLAAAAGALNDPNGYFVWKHINQATRLLPPLDLDRFAAPAKTALDQIAGRRGPPRLVPLTVLLAIAGGVVVLGGLLRLRRRGELLWLLLVPLGAGLAFAFHSLGLARSDPQRLTCVGLIAGLDGNRTLRQGMFDYYAGPQTRDVTFSAGAESGLISNVGGVGAGMLSDRTITFADGRLTLPDCRLETNGTLAVFSQTVAGNDRLVPRLTFGPEGLTGTIDNRLGYGIENAVFYVNRQTYRLGDVPAGKSSEVRVGVEDHLGWVEFSKPPEAIESYTGTARTREHWSKPLNGLRLGLAPPTPRTLSELARKSGQVNVQVRLWLENMSDKPIRLLIHPASSLTIKARQVATEFASLPTVEGEPNEITIPPHRRRMLDVPWAQDGSLTLQPAVNVGKYDLQARFTAVDEGRGGLWTGTLETPKTPIEISAAEEEPADRGRPYGSQRQGQGEFTGQATKSTTAILRNRLVSELLNVPAFRVVVDRRPVLIGYTTRAPMNTLPGLDLERQGWSVVVWPVQIAPPPAGTKVLIPSGFVDVQFPRVVGGTIWQPATEEFIGVVNTGNLQIEARPPGRGWTLGSATATLKIALTATNYDVNVYGVLPSGGEDEAGQLVLLKTLENPAGPQVLRVEDADRFRSADGGFVFRLRIEGRAAPSGASGVSPTTAGGAKVQTVDVQLEGISQ